MHQALVEVDKRRWPVAVLDLVADCESDRSGEESRKLSKETLYLFGELGKNPFLRLFNFLNQALKVTFDLT